MEEDHAVVSDSGGDMEMLDGDESNPANFVLRPIRLLPRCLP
jgi:hypothetical protein